MTAVSALLLLFTDLESINCFVVVVVYSKLSHLSEQKKNNLDNSLICGKGGPEIEPAFTLPPSEPAQGRTLEVSACGRCEQDTPVLRLGVFPSSKPYGLRIRKVLEVFRSGKAGNLVPAF